MITHLRPRRPHPAALDPPDPGDARGPRAAQRAERDVRRGDGVQRWASSSRTSATGCAPSTPRSSRRPGRMNIFDEHPFKVILDYGHNAARGRGDGRPGASGSTSAGRRIVVLAGAGRPARRGHRATSGGSRRASSTTTSAAATTTCAAASRTRCRTCCGRRCWRTACRPTQITVIPDEQAAIDAALREAQPGDLLLIFADAITRSWKQVIQFNDAEATAVPSSARAPRGRSRRSRPPSPSPVDERRRELVRDVRGVRLRRESDD